MAGEAGDLIDALADAPVDVRAVLDALPEPTLLIAGGIIRYANERCDKLFGDGIEGKDVASAIPHPAAVERLSGTRGRALGVVELVGVGESRRHWLMRVAPLGEGALLVRFIDRSEAHAAEQMRVDFVANASHELRTPLATLVGYTETLREAADELDPATRTRFTAIVHDEARRMQRLVEDLISLSRIQAERFSRPRDPLPMAALIEDVRTSWAEQAERRGSTIETEVAADLPPIVGDRNEISQLLDNLVSNAIRYGRPETPIFVGLQRERDMIRLEVRDEGEGIPAEHIPRVTERFYRVDPSRSRALGGTGLGLSIVKHVVERHRGRLSIQSEVGKGTSVTVLLPAFKRQAS